MDPASPPPRRGTATRSAHLRAAIGTPLLTIPPSSVTPTVGPMTLQHSLLPVTGLALSAALLTTPAHAGPTVSADLDLGTSTRSSADAAYGILPLASPLYITGFTFRAGWRFDVAPVWLLPELGASYEVEHYPSSIEGIPTVYPSTTAEMERFFVGGRIGWSGVAMGPQVQFEPSIYGHVGGGWYSAWFSGPPGVAGDAGLSLDLRIRRHFLVGAQVGYAVVTVPSHTLSSSMPVLTTTGPVAVTVTVPGFTDPWVSYGIHAGWLFW